MKFFYILKSLYFVFELFYKKTNSYIKINFFTVKNEKRTFQSLEMKNKTHNNLETKLIF